MARRRYAVHGGRSAARTAAAAVAALAGIVGMTGAAALWGAPGAASAAPLPVATGFYQGVVDEMANPGGSQPGSDDYDCVPTAQHPEPVVLLHDMGATRQSNWATFVPALKNEGYCVYSMTYGVVPGVGSTSMGNPLGGFAPLEESAADLAGFVDGVLDAPGTRRGPGTGKVDLIGHAEGALVAGYYAKVLGGAADVDHLVALAPTWQGVGGPGATVPQPVAGQLMHECPYCVQAAGGSEFIRALNEGGTPYAPGVRYTNIVTRYNWGLDPESGLVPGPETTSIVVQDGCAQDQSEHDGLGASPRAVAFALNALDPEHPRPVPCTVILPFVGTAVG